MAGYKVTNVAATTAAVTNRFVTSVNMKVGAYTVANPSPVWAGGCLVTLTHTTVAAGTDTLGTVALVGTDLFGLALTETLTPVADSTVTSTKVFRTLTSATGAGWVIAGGNDTLVIGCAAGSLLATGGGFLTSLNVNNVVATAFTISDAIGTIATVAASAAIGNYAYNVTWAGFLKLSTTSTNDVTVMHSTGVPSSYAMS